MRASERPGPGEEYNPGPPSHPRQAASVILLRGGSETLELLLVRRTPEARFMGGVWVFPGGAVDAEEGDGDGAHRLAAVRELHEEAAIELADPDELVKFSRWITPAAVRSASTPTSSSRRFPTGRSRRSTGRSVSTSAGSRRRRRSTRTRRSRSCSSSRRSSTSSS